MPACAVSPRIMLAEFISSILTQASGRAEHCTRSWFLPFLPEGVCFMHVLWLVWGSRTRKQAELSTKGRAYPGPQELPYTELKNHQPLPPSTSFPFNRQKRFSCPWFLV